MSKIILALKAIQGRLKVPKNQLNKFGGYNYRSLEDIMEAVKPLLLDEGAVITVSDSIEMVGDRYYVKALAMLHLGDEQLSVSAYAREPLSRKGMDESQITGAASSYARKYAMNGLLAIDDTKDADTAAPPEKAKAKKQKVKMPQATEQNRKVLDSVFGYFNNRAPEGKEVDVGLFMEKVYARWGKFPTTDAGGEAIIASLETDGIFRDKS